MVDGGPKKLTSGRNNDHSDMTPQYERSNSV